MKKLDKKYPISEIDPGDVFYTRQREDKRANLYVMTNQCVHRYGMTDVLVDKSSADADHKTAVSMCNTSISGVTKNFMLLSEVYYAGKLYTYLYRSNRDIRAVHVAKPRIKRSKVKRRIQLRKQ